MKKLSNSSQKILKVVHILFACLWVGGAVALPLLKLGLHPETGQVLYGFDLSRKFVDDFIIIPGAMGCLMTGLCYSLFTGFGFLRLRWITVKWIITLAGVLFGTFWLGPWLNNMPPLSKQLGLEALSNPFYRHSSDMNLVWGMVQLFTIIFAVAISILKPWKSG